MNRAGTDAKMGDGTSDRPRHNYGGQYNDERMSVFFTLLFDEYSLFLVANRAVKQIEHES